MGLVLSSLCTACKGGGNTGGERAPDRHVVAAIEAYARGCDLGDV